MKQIILLRTLRKDLVLVLIIAVLIITSIDFWLINIPECFIGGHKIGQIFRALSMSYISAFILYLLVVHYKQYKDKTILYPYIISQINIIKERATTIGDVLRRKTKITINNKYPTDTDIETICSSLNPKSKAPLQFGLNGRNANWLEYFIHYRKDSLEAIDKIFVKIPFLDSKLVKIISGIETCSFYKMLDNSSILLETDVRNIEFLKTQLIDYFVLIKELEEYVNKHIVIYK